MQKGILLSIFLVFLVFGIAVNSPILIADDDNGNSGSGSDDKNRIREEIKREFRAEDGSRVKIERRVEIKDGEVKIRIKRKIIDAEGNEIEVKIVIERDKDGIRKKIKLEGVEGLEVDTELEIDDEFEGNESELVAILSNGRRAKIKIMPDQLVEIALERLKALNFTMELVEIEYKNRVRAVYNVEANKTGRFLGIFKLKLRLEGQIDPETGEFIRINKPWWAFLVAGENSDQVGEKTTLCHIPPGDPSAAHTISVGAPAVNAHLGRHGGDTLGACSGGEGNETSPPEGNETGVDESPQWFDNSTNSTVNGTLIEHRVMWTDDNALSGYIFSFDNGTGTFVNDSFVAMSGTEDWSNVSKVVNSTVGSTIRWRVYANDTNSSNPFSVTDIFEYTAAAVELDNTPPTIIIDSPTNSTFTTNNIDYNITVNEALTNALASVDGLANMTMTNDSTTHYFNLSSDHLALSDGGHNITFYVNDTSGNENFSTIFFTVNATS
ncbi:MAG TPA: hypothetical protein ENH99_00265 [Candidatus Pacearchaeota archaeon]|nr:hypothetical protein [Candidatus Pacearchaeota archaeon]